MKVEIVNSLDDSVCGITDSSLQQLRVGPTSFYEPQETPSIDPVDPTSSNWGQCWPTCWVINRRTFVSESSKESASAPEKPKIVKKVVKKIKKTNEKQEAELRQAEQMLRLPRQMLRLAKADAEADAYAEAEAVCLREAEAYLLQKLNSKQRHPQEIFDEQTDNEDDEDGKELMLMKLIDGTTHFMTGDGEILGFRQVGKKPHDADENAEPCADFGNYTTKSNKKHAKYIKSNKNK